ncbi:pumilio homolog 12 [Selaginella moellendorffii]|uniref:pumilio homolog 12 n=1 Tax=Selaginella moellendorffii TaxID=88036 RepID=UPI000D1CDB4A|nr:pumilio homolog 12 [Selaginella moellendorffii]|eukprot:XP_002961917.2 pumilio homolog 12 [Selaginella moellendorffii]
MGQDDEDIDQLLGEIPRATSAPPHLDEFRPGRDSTIAQQQEDGLTSSETDSNSSGMYPEGFTTFTPPRAAFDAFGFGLSNSKSVNRGSCTTTSHDSAFPQDETGNLVQLPPNDPAKFTGGYVDNGLYRHSQRSATEYYDYLRSLQQDRILQAQKQQVFLFQRELEEERQRRLQQHILQQQIHDRAAHLYGLQTQALLAAAVAPYRAGRQLQPSAVNRDVYHRQPTSQGHIDSICRYYAQGYCSRGDQCPYLHIQAPVTGNRADKYPSRAGKSSVSRTRKKQSNGGYVYATGLENEDADEDGFYGSSKSLLYHDLQQLQLGSSNEQALRYSSLKEVEGRIYSIAKDQYGCRFLQRRFDEGVAEDLQKIFEEIIDHIVDLMTDPFGNYLVQKLLEVCTEDQRLEILRVVCSGDELISISLNMHGTRAVQKLIETLKSPEQVSMITSSLEQGIVILIKDLNGNHVVQRCLQRLGNEENQFIFDAAAQHCVEVGTHRHGCCVLQRCVDFSKGVQKERLVGEIAANALVLSQDQYGNYVVQYILDEAPWIAPEVMAQLEGHHAHLAMQKFSSNVVEKCLKQGADDKRARIIHELTKSAFLGQLLQDPFANYVIQCALTVTKGALHASLVEAIRPHLPALRSSPYGKRILCRTNLKKA